MEWLKAIIGEEAYNKLVENGTLEILKKSMGDTEYVANDPLKIIPKHVFNEKNEENKLLKTQIEEYKKQLKTQGELVTDAEMKTKLATQEAELKQQMKEMQAAFDAEKEKTKKEQLIKDVLISEGCQYPDLIIKQLNYEDVIIKDDKILNSDKVILPIKEQYKNVFDKKVTGQTPPAGNTPPPPSNPTKEELVKKHDELQKAGNFTDMMKVRRQIQELEQE